MEIPPKIRYAAQRLREGHRVNRITVRDFLGHFGAERRGAAKVEAIRDVLDSLDLRTEPDFESAWIDGPIWLLLKQDVDPPDAGAVSVGDLHGDQACAKPDESEREEMVLDSTPSSVEQAVEQSASALTSTLPDAPEATEEAEISDPTFRIGSLPAANKTLIAVNQDDDITRAVTLMLQYDFSQLPVMQGERELKGVVSWKSIGSRLSIASKRQRVADYQEDARIVDASRTLFDSIPIIIEQGYVLVRQRDRRITGIVTASDLSIQFRTLTEPFLLLREIELQVRRLLQGKITPDDLAFLGDPVPTSRKSQNITDLTFGDYVRLFQSPLIWAKLNLNIDAATLTKLLDDVRRIRNDVMHFDPDPMTENELGTLKRTVRFMQELFELLS